MNKHTPTDINYEKRIKAGFEKQPIMKLLNATLLKIAPGVVSIELPFNKTLTLPHGFIHAGIITTIIDNACGFAAYTLIPANSEVLAVEFKINFISPAVGEKFIANGKVLKSGKIISVCSGEVTAIQNGQEKVVAAMQTTMICTGKK